LAKVRLGDLVCLGTPENHDDERRRRIDATPVDFVICQPHSLRPRLAIRLIQTLPDSSDPGEGDEDESAGPQEESEFVGDVLDAAGIPRIDLDVDGHADVPRLRQMIRRGLA
jgi:hypothetical protein